MDHNDLMAMEARFKDNIRRLMKTIGADEGTCSGCHSMIYWVVTKKGKRAPFDPSGISHFATCPKAGDFKR